MCRKWYIVNVRQPTLLQSEQPFSPFSSKSLRASVNRTRNISFPPPAAAWKRGAWSTGPDRDALFGGAGESLLLLLFRSECSTVSYRTSVLLSNYGRTICNVPNPCVPTEHVGNSRGEPNPVVGSFRRAIKQKKKINSYKRKTAEKWLKWSGEQKLQLRSMRIFGFKCVPPNRRDVVERMVYFRLYVGLHK